MRLVFAGTPAFAAAQLEALISAGTRPLRVYAQPDRPSGRGRKVQRGAAAAVADLAGIPVLQPLSLRGEIASASLAELMPDLMIVAAYGMLLPPAILSIPRLGCVNVHASLLPRWRGAAPVERAMLAGDAVTGVTLMQMDAGLDTGPILASRSTTIDSTETGGRLEARLAALGAELLVASLPALRSGSLAPAPQDETLATLAPKLTDADARVDWQESAEPLARRIRALADRRPVWTQRDGVRIQFLQALPAAAATDAPPGVVLVGPRQTLRVSCGGGTVLEIGLLRVASGKGTAIPAVQARGNYPQWFSDGRTL